MADSLPKAGGIIATHGTWSLDLHGAWVGCPHTCMTYSHVASANIGADGDVTPSFDCPNCDYDELIILTGWDPDPQ